MKAIKIQKYHDECHYFIIGPNITIAYKEHKDGDCSVLINPPSKFIDFFGGIYFPNKGKCELFIKDIFDNFEIDEVLDPQTQRYGNGPWTDYDIVSEQIKGE